MDAYVTNIDDLLDRLEEEDALSVVKSPDTPGRTEGHLDHAGRSLDRGLANAEVSQPSSDFSPLPAISTADDNQFSSRPSVSSMPLPTSLNVPYFSLNQASAFGDSGYFSPDDRPDTASVPAMEHVDLREEDVKDPEIYVKDSLARSVHSDYSTGESQEDPKDNLSGSEENLSDGAPLSGLIENYSALDPGENHSVLEPDSFTSVRDESPETAELSTPVDALHLTIPSDQTDVLPNRHIALSFENGPPVPLGFEPEIGTEISDCREPVVEHEISRPVEEQVVGFQSALWNAVDDVSDTELEQFLSKLENLEQRNEGFDGVYQESPSENDSREPYTLDTALDHLPTREFQDFDHIPEDVALAAEIAAAEETFSHDLAYFTVNTDELEQIRLSPPLELAPPVPMTLIDVSDMDLSLTQSESDEIASGNSFLASEGSLMEDTFDQTSLAVPEGALLQLDDSAIASSSNSGVSDPSEGILPVDLSPSDGTDAVHNDENVPTTSTSPAVIFSVDNLGKVKPQWVPDEFAPICMLCGLRFSLVKRRHHCRACGSVICASCGNYKAKLEYLDKEDRICALCNETFLYKRGVGERMDLGADDPRARRPSLVQPPVPVVVASSSSPVAVPPGVLRRQDRPRNSVEQKSVVFSDGIRPGGDLMESESHGNGRRLAIMNAKRQRRSPGGPEEAPPPPKAKMPPKRSSASHVVRLFVNREVLPVMELTSDGHYILHERPDLPQLLLTFTSTPSDVVDFFVNACLRISVQILDLKCCVGQTVWCYSTSGMRLVGQDEIVMMLEKQDTDILPPRDVFIHLNEIFLNAKQGNTIGNLGHSIVGLSGYQNGFLANRNNAGFLFVRRTFQCLTSIKTPEPPYLFGILMTKWEVPWAKLFPMRLMMRLGAEFRYYPCSFVSYRDRKAVFEEIGHTVMNLLCDFRNFQYHLPCVEDTDCCMEKGVVTVHFPRYRYDQIVKVCQGSNEHVLPIGLSLSKRADAHLVCVQNLENGQYETQAINIQSQNRQATGTSFVIFNGSLKTTDPTECRISVVEDGIMVQVTPRGLEDIKTNLKAMKGVSLAVQTAPASEGPSAKEALVIEWTDEKKTCNTGVRSPIDGKDLTGVESRRVSLKHSVDFLNGTLCVRCTEVFLTDEKEPNTNHREEVDLSRLAENLAMATCSIIRGHLYDYRDSGSTKIGLRVTLGPDLVEYEIGTKGERFIPDAVMEFDEKIMRLLNECARAWDTRPRLEMELVFRIFQH